MKQNSFTDEEYKRDELLFQQGRMPEQYFRSKYYTDEENYWYFTKQIRDKQRQRQAEKQAEEDLQKQIEEKAAKCVEENLTKLLNGLNIKIKL